MERLRLLAIIAAIAAVVPALAQPPTGAVVLVTLDGARIEEIFGGLDAAIVASQLKADEHLEDQPIYRRFWAPTPEARRARLMPFFWGTLMRDHGSIAGDPARGSRVHVANNHAFSYPGYSEMLVGRAHDDVIKSNAPIRNPYPTVLEFLKQSGGLSKEQVAVFTSWNVHSAIVEHTEGSLTVNAGFSAFATPNEEVRRQSALQFETPTPWNEVRHDAYTFRFAMDHLARHQPRVLYLALGETDDWAHDGRYDRVLEALARSDHYLEAAVDVAAVAALVSRLDAHPDHDRSRPRAHAEGLEGPRKRCRGFGRDVDGVRVAVDERPWRMERRAADCHRTGGGDADYMDGRRLDQVRFRRRPTRAVTKRRNRGDRKDRRERFFSALSAVSAVPSCRV